MNDIHISKDNIPEFHKNWNEALEICKDKGISDIIIGGDLWHSSSAQTLNTLLAVKDAIVKAQTNHIHLTIAEGNHDLVDRESLQGYSHIFQGYDEVDVVGDFLIIDFTDKLTLYVMSYFPENGSFVERLQNITEDSNFNKDATNILYIHEGIRGGLAQPCEDELPADIFKDFDAVLVGHYHDRKKIPGTRIEYIGASRQHNFGENEEKGYTVLYDDGSYEFIKNEVNIRYRNVTVSYTGLDNAFLDSLAEVKEDSRYKVKVKVNCSSKEAANVDKQKLLDAGASKVEIVTEQTEPSEIKAHELEVKFDKSGIKKEYTGYCSGKGIDNTMGLKYLDKIN